MVLLFALSCADAFAHAGLVLSNPVAGATLGASPSAIELTFSERPESSLSSISVLDTRGSVYQVGHPGYAPDNPNALIIRVRTLARGVYTVSWRALSADDGHASEGSYAFGVGISPSASAVSAAQVTQVTSRLEVLARWLLLLGLIAIVGAIAASVARFGGPGQQGLVMATCGWVLSALGLVLLAESQRRNAHASFSDLSHTSIGRALLWRGLAIAAAGGALLSGLLFPRVRRAAMPMVGVAALAAIAVHVATGHAAASSWPFALAIVAQSVHVGAVGVWLGGLAALLLGLRGAPLAAKAARVRRFSRVAAVGLVVVATTGIVRAINELTSVDDLITNSYGFVVLAKIVLLLGIAAFGLRNRLSSVPVAATTLSPLRRTSRAELVLAGGALAAAAALGSIAPPATGRSLEPTGIRVSGVDAAHRVRVELKAASADPGANSFVAAVKDYGAKAPVRDAQVSLNFKPLDDPGTLATSLELHGDGAGSYVGSGANLAFDGRWRVTVLVRRAMGTNKVPLELQTHSPAQFVSIERLPGRAPKYTVQIGSTGYIRVSPHPERAGLSRIFITCYDAFGDETPVREAVVTSTASHAPTYQHPLRQLGAGRFLSPVVLASGTNIITVVARTRDGARLRATVSLDVPRR